MYCLFSLIPLISFYSSLLRGFFVSLFSSSPIVISSLDKFLWLELLITVGLLAAGFVAHYNWYSKALRLFNWGAGPEEAKEKVLKKLREQDSLRVFTDKELERAYHQLVQKLRNIHFITTKAWQNIQEKKFEMRKIPFPFLESYTEEDRLADEKEKTFMKPFLQKLEEENRVWRERQKLYEEKFKPTGLMY